MKNQYFGDINDYRKYGLIRLLTGHGELSTAVCWMLTPDDGRTDGIFIDYLKTPERWRHFDEGLYDKLKGLVVDQEIRDVKLAERANLIPSASYYDKILYDHGTERSRYFEAFWDLSQNSDLVFFDPDNGMEVRSKPCGRKDSSKYLYWEELSGVFSRGHSVLVYQHFPRENRDGFIKRMARETKNQTGAPNIYSFRTAHVVFFLLTSEHHTTALEQSIPRVREIWGAQMTMQKH